MTRLDCRAAEAKLTAIRALCNEPRAWDDDDADSPEARAARAYNHALAKVAAVLDGKSS